MTLRFFRRKSATSQTSPEETAVEEQVTQPESSTSTRPAPRRRGGARSSGRSRKDGTAAAAAAGTESASTAKPPASRSRRGRRGGGRKAAKQPAETPAGAPEPAPVTPVAAEPATPAALPAQQQAGVQELIERQIAALKGLQGSLSAIENRLSGMDRRGGGVQLVRVGIFVDVPNVMYAAKRLRVTLDYGKMLELLVSGRELVRASAYAPISDDPEVAMDTQKFVQPFVDLGYRVVTKPHKRYADGSMKANFDVELAMDVLMMSDRLDIVILVSGDGDFRRLVELVASKGVRVEVVAFGQSMASELRTVADKYIDLNDHLEELRAK